MHCNTGDGGQVVADELQNSAESSNLDKAENLDSVSQNISVAFIQEHNHSVENTSSDYEGSTANPYCKLQSMIQQDSGQDKSSSERTKTAKPHIADTGDTYSFTEVEVSEDGLHSDISMIRSSLVTLENNCNEPLNNRVSSNGFRGSDGPFFSSMSLWGFAMKTLQNETDMEQ